MKRITLLLTALLFSFATLAQSYMMDPETEDKIMQRRQLEQEESLKALKEVYRNIHFPKEDTQVFTDYSKGLTYDGEINVLLLSPDGGSWEPLRTALDAFAFINATSFPVASLPSLTVGDLLPYEVVLVFNNNQWLAAGGVNPTVVGDVLAAYIEQGGMIVENSYVMDYGSSLWAMQGAYITGNYSAFTRAVNDLEGSFTLGTVLVPDHPIMTGVSALSAASVLIQDNGIATGATRIADWNNGQVLLAAKDNVVSFNLLPLASGALTFTGDGITLYRNAIVWMMLNLADPDAPAAPTNLTAVAGAEGALSATISWNNPSETFGGEPLTELTSVELSRGGTVIHTVASPVIGGEVTYVDNDVPAAGTYSYSVRGINTAGEGFGASVSIYIGEDVPAAPGNVVLVAQGNDGFITWDAPTEGLNGGYLSGTGLVYTVRRMPANVIVAENITATEYLDDQVPGIGNYFYNVTVANAIGTGGTASSNIALLGAEGVLMYETFDYPAGAIPPGWELTGVAHAWTVNNSSSAGGTAPELRLNWSPAATGMSRLVTYPINVEDHAELRLKYRQFLSNFSTNEGEIAAIDVSFDGGTTWTPAWEYVITANIPVGEYELFIDVPPAKSTMHLGFRFSGNSYNINQWYLDNMILEPVAAADLVALSITGNTTPSVGMETLYTIKVQNAGNETQTDYTVKLMREGGIEIASAAGTAIEFGETLSFQLAWTPTEDDEGPTFLYGYVDFEDDGVPGNNQTANLNVVVQPEDIIVVTIGTSETFPPSRIPFDFYFKNSLSQTLYFADEIGLGGGVLTGVQYTNNFATNLPGKPVKVWVGETDLTDLTGGWVDPASLTLVYDGELDFPSGVNGIFVPFTMPYVYGGGNLVIYTQRIWEDQYFNSLDRFYGTEFPGSNRTRRASADATVYDPTAPPAGNTINWAPNTALFFSTAGLGSLTGTVTDGTNPIEGVQVQVMGTFMKTFTDADGEYAFPFMLADTYNVEFSKFGFETLVVEGVEVEVEEETIQDATLIAIPQFTVTGIVKGNDDVLQEGAVVTFVGYDTYSATTNASGAFTLDDVYAGTYTITVMAEGYEVFTQADIVVDANLDLGTLTVVEIIVAPFGLTIEIDEDNPTHAMFSWNDLLEREFRFDDGTATGQLGSGGGTLNTVLGAAHRHDATLYEMSWYLTSEGGPHNIVKVWVFGLDANGQPNRNDILFQQASVPNVDGQWNTFEFPEPVEAPNGFLIGLSYAGFLGLGTDAGTSTEWPFQPNTNFFTGNVTADNFAAIETLGAFPFNFLIRAFGADHGPLNVKGGEYADAGNNAGMLEFVEMSKPVATGFPVYSKPVMHNTKAFTGFNVFLNDMTTPVAANIAENYHLFENLPGGDHTAGVQSVYTTGVSEIKTIEFFIDTPIPQFASVQIIHNSADAAVAAVDIFVGNEPFLENVAFRTATGFIPVPAEVELELYVAPAGAGFDNAVGPIAVTFAKDQKYVVVANGIVSSTGYDPVKPFALYPFANAREQANQAGNTDLLVFHGATDAPEVSVFAQGVANQLFSFEYGQFAGYLELPTVDYVLEVRNAAGTDVVAVFEAPLQTLNLAGEALVVVASGFLNPANNSNGAAFGLWAATAAGGALVELPNVTSVSDMVIDGNFLMYPNPTSGDVNLQSAHMIREVKVIDITGRTVYANSVEANDYRINTRGFNSGIYFVQIVTSEGTIVTKLQVKK